MSAHTPYGSADFDSRQFRTAMGQFCTGVTVITTLTADDQKRLVDDALSELDFAALSSGNER